jgi:hypothetical protein
MRALSFAVVILLFAASLSAQQQVNEPGDMQHVVLIDANQSIQMRDHSASRKGNWRVVVSSEFLVFKGAKASLRTKTTGPEFQFEMDPDFDNPVYLYRFDVYSDRRQIRVARSTGGLTQMSIPMDHLIKATMEEIGSGQNSMKRYRLKPTAPLKPGEYCLSRSISTCYDFGVE